MTEVEGRLRDTLASNAEDAPAPRELLHRVRVQARRQQRRHHAGLAGGLALVSAAVALAVVGYAGPAADGPTIDGPAGGGQVAGIFVQFVPSGAATVSFPYTPAMPLPGFGEPLVTLEGGVPTLRYGPNTDGLSVAVTLKEQEPSPAQTESMDADIKEFALPKGKGHAVICSSEPVDMATLRRYVSFFEEKPLVMAAPYVFDLVPDGFTVDNLTPSAVTFTPPGKAASPDFEGKIAVLLDADYTGPEGTQVTDESVVLHRRLGNGRTLTVQVPAGMPLRDADLARFADGVHLGAAAQPGKG